MICPIVWLGAILVVLLNALPYGQRRRGRDPSAGGAAAETAPEEPAQETAEVEDAEQPVETAGAAASEPQALGEPRFWIYENWRATPHRAKIHLASCMYCNDGRGANPERESSGANDRWRGPFRTVEEAVEAAQGLDMPHSPCGHCRSYQL